MLKSELKPEPEPDGRSHLGSEDGFGIQVHLKVKLKQTLGWGKSHRRWI